jgi:hypothetical protein
LNIKAAIAGSVALFACATPALARELAHPEFTAVMDSVFGAGNWRQTGGYRTPEREDELRAQGALTVPAGALSRHSVGRPGAPGAYDLVVHNLSPWEAAARLRQAGAPFYKLFPEGAHGTQGPHLHVEPYSLDLKTAAARSPGIRWMVADPTPAEQAINLLHAQSAQGQADAQLRLGQVYAAGRGTARDLIAAFVWTSLAASNSEADPATRRDAEIALAALTRTMKPDDLSQARQFVRDPSDPARCGSGSVPGGVPILVVGLSNSRQPTTPAAETRDSCARSNG